MTVNVYSADSPPDTPDMMKIELTSDQIHWLKYALINTIRNLPTDDDEVRQVLMSVLNKLDEPIIDASQN